jgi:hypothetical protein
MKNLEADTIISRYACLDFSQIYGFPNPLPKDEYFLRNGPKFNGDDLSLTWKHLSNFHDFTELLRVKHEDVFLRLFHDSFQGKCKSWVEGFPAGSIRTITTFWIVFLETWMEGTKFVADSPSIQSFMEWNDMCIEYGGDENFSACLSSYLKSCKCSSEAKIQFLDEFSKDMERELKALEVQETPQIPPFLSLPCEVLCQQKQDCTWLPSPFDLGDQQTNFNNHDFYDPMAEYMEIFFSLISQSCLHCDKKKYYEFPLPSQIPVFTLLKHNQAVQLCEKLLDWIYWKFEIT